MQRLHVRTPLIRTFGSDDGEHRHLYLKMESVQPSGSFKIRGIGRLCQYGGENGVTQFVCSSGGNAGCAAAYAGRMLGINTTVFVPSSTPADSTQKIAALGASVNVHGDVWDDADQEAVRYAEQVDALYVSPFDHPLIWEGHSTIVDEIVQELTEIDAVVLSVGGGGLLCGVVEGLRRNGLEDVPVVAVETAGTASFAASLTQGRLVSLNQITGVATSLGAKTVSRQALAWSRHHQIRSVVVSDAQAVDACVRFANEHRCLVEPACGASLAVVYAQHPELSGSRTIVVIVCGGMGVDLKRLQRWIDNPP